MAKYTPEQYIIAVNRCCEIPHAGFDACRWCGIPIEHFTHNPVTPHTDWCFVTVVSGALKFAIEKGYFAQQTNDVAPITRKKSKVDIIC
jgi:hypothetical protein